MVGQDPLVLFVLTVTSSMANLGKGTVPPGLFGIKNSNRNFELKNAWGKNQFNNSFPVALTNYLYSVGEEPVYIVLDEALDIRHKRIRSEELYGAPWDSEELFFEFEGYFKPFEHFLTHDSNLDKADLITCRSVHGRLVPLKHLEIKLTAIPDSTTEWKQLSEQSVEIVIRPPSIEYLALGIASLYREDKKTLRDLLYNPCALIDRWEDVNEMGANLPSVKLALELVLQNRSEFQTPEILQPVWRTEGTNFSLSKNCFDIFVWSNFAFTKLFLDRVRTDSSYLKISRPERTAIWLASILWDFANDGDVQPKATFDRLSYGTKNDKAFAVSGGGTHPYLACRDLAEPRIKSLSLPQIILGNGYKFLKPERRLDAAICFIADSLFS
jgi:hypothetical protein